MNWINNVVRPKIRSLLTTKRELPDNLWVKCPDTGQMVFYKDLEANQFVIPGSNYHMRMDAQQAPAASLRRRRVREGAGARGRAGSAQVPRRQALHRPPQDRQEPTPSSQDAVLVGEGTLDGQEVVAAAQDFRFMGGSLGMAAGEAVIAGMLRAVEKHTPFILFAASGGARMQEGILSLMQMPRTTIAVQRLREARLPYIVVLTDPDHRRRHRLLRHAGRRAHRRARRAHLLRRPARHPADHPRAAARGLPEGRVPAGARHGRHGRAPPPAARDAGAAVPPAHRATPPARARAALTPPTSAAISTAARSTASRIETLARSYGDVMDAEPNGEAERLEPRETTRDPDKPRSRPPRDGIRN